ncbi:ensconsin isoform X3 [Neocloeon triangulifer]|uniref:ensconsin isoform X3 n=1 Tax=Neocloeon triangulifer TaxID=2078957 RepID=UPI00286F8C64|nr:ensconsin isoform X3 [Neocloeon triangulifer]
MIVELVKRSVLQCFCHSCRAPIAGARRNAPQKKPKTGRGSGNGGKNKKVKFITTEIRCQEESRGGLRYEVILAEPLTDTPPKPRPVSPQAKTPDIETITEKMVAAEERRKSLEASKLNELKAKMNRIEEAAKKRDEQTQEFINVTKNALDQKMKVHTEKHEEYLGDLISKVKEHLEIVDKHRQSTTESGDKQTEEVRTSLEERLRTASEQREEHLRKQLERLKEHEKRCEMARQKREQLLLEGNQPCNEETTVAASSG